MRTDPKVVWTLGIMGFYLAVVLAIGIGAFRIGGRGLADFAVANRTFGIPVLTFTFAATFLSAFGFMGVVAFVYAHGSGFGAFAVWNCTAVPLLSWLLGRKLWVLGKRYNYITTADVLGDYYESDAVRLLTALIGVVFLVPYIGVQMVAAGLMFQVVTAGAMPFLWGALIFMLIMIAYTVLGGIRGVAWTDFFQGVIMYIFLLVAILLLVYKLFGGFGGAFEAASLKVPANLSIPGRTGFMNMGNIVAMQISTTLALLFGPHLFIRYYAARSLYVLKWSIVGMSVYTSLWTALMFVLGLGVAAMFPGHQRPDMLMPELIFKYAPVWIGGWVISGALAAAMSTADSQLHAAATVFTRDIYEKLIVPRFPNLRLSERSVVTFTRIIIVVFAAISFWAALYMKQLIVIITALAGGGFAQLVVPTFGALYWKRASKAGALSSMLVGLLVLLTFELKWLPSPFKWMSILWALLANVAVFVVVSLITRAPSDKAVEKIQGFSDRVLAAFVSTPVGSSSGKATISSNAD